MGDRPKLTLRRKIASTVWPTSVEVVDKLNQAARYERIWRSTEGVAYFPDQPGIWAYVNEHYVRNRAVDYLEFGVHRGFSLGRWIELNTNPQSRFFGFDSFVGLPEDWNSVKKDFFDVGGTLPPLTDSRLTFVKGWFQNTLDPFLEAFDKKNLLLVHIDSDLYSSALYCLTKLEKLLEPGVVVIFDEFGDGPGEFRALQDFCSAYLRKWRLIASTESLWGAAIVFE